MSSWWAAISEPGRALLARDELNKLPGCLAFFPFDRIVQRRHKTPARTYNHRVLGHTPKQVRLPDEVVFEPLWGNYMMLKTPEEADFASVLACRGVRDVVRGAGKVPIEIPERVADKVYALYNGLQNDHDTTSLTAFFKGKVGDRFVFKPSSSLPGMIGTIVSLMGLDEKEELQALVEAFGRVVPVTLKFKDVERVIGAPIDSVLAAA